MSRLKRPREGVVVPWFAVALALGTVALLAAPIVSLIWETPWDKAFETARAPSSLTSLRLSLVVSGIAATLSAIFGIPLAMLLAFNRSRLGPLLRTVVILPLILPPVATGVGLLTAFGRQGLLGRTFGFGLTNTMTGAVVAATIVSMPFLILSVEGGFRQTDRELARAATTLGASPFQQWRRVWLPATRGPIVAGLVLAWARALGEFGATITFAGNIEGSTRTLPLQIALSLEQDRTRALVLSVLMVFVSLVILLSLRKQWFPRLET